MSGFKASQVRKPKHLARVLTTKGKNKNPGEPVKWLARNAWKKRQRNRNRANLRAAAVADAISFNSDNAVFRSGETNGDGHGESDEEDDHLFDSPPSPSALEKQDFHDDEPGLPSAPQPRQTKKRARMGQRIRRQIKAHMEQQQQQQIEEVSQKGSDEEEFFRVPVDIAKQRTLRHHLQTLLSDPPQTSGSATQFFAHLDELEGYILNNKVKDIQLERVLKAISGRKSIPSNLRARAGKMFGKWQAAIAKP
ncbi:hypothetical protein BC567DRAFT_213208 [Phyllosticta citribraziliensis]